MRRVADRYGITEAYLMETSTDAANAGDAVAEPKLGIEMYRDEVKALEKLESWGGTLFLGAIALIAKQIIDWGAIPKDNSIPVVCLHWSIYLLPALIGLVAFIFLRIVNYRIRSVRYKLYKLAQGLAIPRRTDDKTSFGSVGWSMALMPLLFGYAATGYLHIGRTELQEPFCLLFALALGCVCIGMLFFLHPNKESGK